jgi:signal transduction histidine kinase
LLRGDKLLGLLYLDNRLLPNLFTERHLQLISAFAGHAAIAIENASSYQELECEKRRLDEKVSERTADLRDANERLQLANQKLQQMDEAKTVFVSVVSHELRTPLTSIKCYLDNLLDGVVGPLSERQAYYIRRSGHNIDQLTRMVHDLLDLSKIETGLVKLDLAQLNLPDILLETVDNLQSTAAAKQITLTARHLGSPLTFDADRDKFQQILTNLIHNAAKFTPMGGKIEVHSEEDGNYVRFCVADTGCGIAQDEIGKIFGTFYRGTGASDQRGAGLGLSICESVVRHHKGRIWVESVLGEGSRFYFTLPRVKECQD